MSLTTLTGQRLMVRLFADLFHDRRHSFLFDSWWKPTVVLPSRRTKSDIPQPFLQYEPQPSPELCFTPSAGRHWRSSQKRGHGGQLYCCYDLRHSHNTHRYRTRSLQTFQAAGQVFVFDFNTNISHHQHLHPERSMTHGMVDTALSHRSTLTMTSTGGDQLWAGLLKFSS